MEVVLCLLFFLFFFISISSGLPCTHMFFIIPYDYSLGYRLGADVGLSSPSPGEDSFSQVVLWNCELIPLKK